MISNVLLYVETCCDNDLLDLLDPGRYLLTQSHGADTGLEDLDCPEEQHWSL